MADEKILQDELMTDEELEQVAGGHFAYTGKDNKFLIDMGYMTETVTPGPFGNTIMIVTFTIVIKIATNASKKIISAMVGIFLFDGMKKNFCKILS